LLSADGKQIIQSAPLSGVTQLAAHKQAKKQKTSKLKNSKTSDITILLSTAKLI